MELMTAIETRKSIRAYKADTPVSKADLEALISAAQQAPTWKNSQTGRYYIITTPSLLSKVKEQALPPFNAKNCADAPALIVTAFETAISGHTNGVADNELADGWGIYDLGLQNQNLMLRATQLGLGTLVMGIRNEEALRALLNIPTSQKIVSVISVGYPDIDPKKPRRKPREELTTWL